MGGEVGVCPASGVPWLLVAFVLVRPDVILTDPHRPCARLLEALGATLNGGQLLESELENSSFA